MAWVDTAGAVRLRLAPRVRLAVGDDKVRLVGEPGVLYDAQTAGVESETMLEELAAARERILSSFLEDHIRTVRARLRSRQRARSRNPAVTSTVGGSNGLSAEQLWQRMDVDGDGTVTMDEIQTLGKALGAKMKKKQLKATFSTIDKDGSGDIDFDEFSQWWGECQQSSGGAAGLIGEMGAKLKDEADQKLAAAAAERVGITMQKGVGGVGKTTLEDIHKAEDKALEAALAELRAASASAQAAHSDSTASDAYNGAPEAVETAIAAGVARLMLLVDGGAAEAEAIERAAAMNAARERTRLRGEVAKLEADTEVEAQRLHDIGFHFSQLADEAVRVAEEAESGYARWCADVDGAEREKMWEKAGGKTRFKEMKVKREEAKSRAKNKREIARAAEAKRDKEKAVAAQARESAVSAKKQAEAVRQQVNKEEADEAVARANAGRAQAAMREYLQVGTMLLRRKLSSSVQIASLREGEVRRLRTSFAETLVRIEHGVGRWNARWEERYESERPPWQGRPEADRAGWNAEELVRQKAEVQMLDEIDSALKTARKFLAEEQAHFKKMRDTFGSRHGSTDEANERVIAAQAKVKAAEALSEQNHAEVDQGRIERHEAFEGVQQRMDAVWSMDALLMERSLFKAAMEEDAAMIGRLLEAGVDTSCQNIGGQTPLELAATRGKLQSLFLLLDEDGSGQISKVELRQLGRAVGVELSDKDIKPLMAVLDNDESGSIDLDEFSDDYSRSFIANFLAKISPAGFGWVEEEIKKMQRLDSMLEKKLAADKAEREAMKAFATKAAGVIATKAAKAAAKKAAEDAAAAAEALAREELRTVLLQCVNEGATNMDGMKAVLGKLECDDGRESETAAALLERWKARLKSHRHRQEQAEAREQEREARRRAKADREAAEALCNLEPDVFAERLDMVMRRVADLEPGVLEEEASCVLRQAAGHAGDAITELTRRRVRQDTAASAVEAAVVLQTTPPGTSVQERQTAFRDALAAELDGIDVTRIHVTAMGPAGALASSDATTNSRAPPPATPGWLRLSFRVLEPYGREADDGAASSEMVLHRLDELAVDGGGLKEAMESIGGLVRYEPDKHAAARAQSREMKALAALGVDNDAAERAAADAKAEEEARAACQPIPLPLRRVTYAIAGSNTHSGSPSKDSPAITFDHTTVWLWYYIQGSEGWREKDREGVRRVVFKYRRLRFGGGHEGVDDEPDPESRADLTLQVNSGQQRTATKGRARQQRKQRKAALSDPVKAAFERYDVDGSGALDVDEVTALLHDQGFRMSSAELAGVFEAIDDDGNGVLDLSELRKMWTFLGMHMAVRGTAREHVASEDGAEEEETLSAPSVTPGNEVDMTGWCALSGPAVKCEDGWWRSCDWPLAPGFEHSVWVDDQMVGTFHDPALVVTAPPNEEDAEEEEDKPIVMVTKVGSKTVTTVIAKSRDSDEEGSADSGKWRRKKKGGPRYYSFDPVPGLAQQHRAGTSSQAIVTELNHTVPRGKLVVSIDYCKGLKRSKKHRSDGVFCVVVANNSGLARRSGTVYASGKTLSWKGHHGTIVFSGLDAPPPLLHILVLRKARAASIAEVVTDSDGGSRSPSGSTNKSLREVRAALVEIYTTHKPSKLESVDALLREWKGHEGELLANVAAKYTAQDSADFDAWGRTGGCVLLGAVSLQFDHAPAGRSWQLTQVVQLLHPGGTHGDPHDNSASADDEGATMSVESEDSAGVSVCRMLLGARGGPGGWGSDCVHIGKLRTNVRWLGGA